MYTKEDLAKPSFNNESLDNKADSFNNKYDSIIKQKDALFNSLESSQTELNRDELLDLSAIVFENSVKDGLSLATKLRLTPTEIASIISSPSFILKHSKLASEVIKEIAASTSVIDNKNMATKLAGNIFELVHDLEIEPKTGEEMTKKLQIFVHGKLKAGSSSRLRLLVSGVDDYYKKFIVKTEFENVDQKGDPRTKGEKLAEDSLERILPVLEEKYLAGEVINTLYQYLKNDDPQAINQISKSKSSPKDIVLNYLKRNAWSQKDIDQLKYESLVSKELLDNLGVFFKFDKLTERRFSAGRYKPLDLVYNAGKDMAKDQLIKEIETSIKNRSHQNIKIVFNKETKEYEVREVKSEEERKKEDIKIEKQEITSEIKEIDVSKYSFPNNFYNIGNRIAFLTESTNKDGGTEKFFVTEDGREIGRDKKYDEVSGISSINNRIVFGAKKDGKYFVVTEDGRELGREREYDYVYDVTNINEQIVFGAKKDGKYFVVTEDGRELGLDKEYGFVTGMINVNKQIVFIAEKDNKYFTATEDGREIGKEYDNVSNITNINNKIVFKATKDGKLFVVTEDGREIGRGKEYQNVSYITNINEQIVFMARKNSRNFVVTEDGLELGKEYDEVSRITSVNNQIVFVARKNHKEFVVTEDGREIGRDKKYDEVSRITSINNRIVFMVIKNHKEFVVTEDGREIGRDKKYDEVSRITSINNRIVFRVKKDGKYFFVTEDGRELGKKYDDVVHITNIDNQLVFIAKKDDKYFVVTEDGREIGKETGKDYNSIYILIGDNKFIIACAKKEKDISGKTSWKLFKETIGSGEKEVKENNFELSESEKSKLELLNLVNNPEKNKINEYLLSKSKLKEENNKNAWQKLKSGVENSKAVVKALNQIISKIPEVFLNTNKAHADKNLIILRDQLLMKIFPEIYKADSKNWLRAFSGSGGSSFREKSNREKRKNNQAEDPSVYLSPEANSIKGGDPSPEHGEEKEIMILRDKLNDFISSSLLGKGLDNPGAAAKSFFSLNHKSEGPFTKTTITLPNIGNLHRIMLPKPVTANVILERVKGITKNNEEISLETETNSLGEVNVLLGKNRVEKVVYSLQVSQDPLDRIIPKISDGEYSRYQERFIKENGQDLRENMADLPEELEFFADLLKALPPKDRVIAVEQFVKQYGYYDFKNGEINDLKNGKSTSEQVLMMEMRMEQLKEANPELKNKKYAGVCSDFALLNTALLRKAGILSGVATGFGSSEKNIYPSMAHGVSYVVFPDSHNLNQVFTVDPTPTGVNAEEEKLLAKFREPSISEKETRAEDEINTEKIDALKSLNEIEKTIGLGDLEALGRLTNGKLEDALNTILKYEVRADNLRVVSNLLLSYWYSPLNKLDFNDADDQVYFKDTFKNEINRVRSEIEAHPELKDKPSGSELFNLIKDFKDKFTKNSNGNGLDLIDKIVDLNKTELNSTEQQALTVISSYLRAKNMLGKL